jgi:hydroxyethylthiazole kinase
MLISPPFLPTRLATETEDEWIDRCMAGGRPGDGAFPLSLNLGWHGGMHLIAPMNGDQPEPVRAIADGTVVFLRKPTQQPSGPLPADHPLAYRGRWTDDGVVVLRHETEIGEGLNGQVVFFSISMHLGAVHPALAEGRTVYRKAEVGTAGQIYGDTQRRIHFEIVCNDANLRALVGRSTGELRTDVDGRLDAVYGQMYFVLSGGTPFYDRRPLDHLTAAHIQPPKPNAKAPLPPVEALQAVYTSSADTTLVVGLRHAGGDGAEGHRGSAYLATLRLDGTSVGDALEELDAEYNLYSRANEVSNSYPADARPAVSAVYELLRFGRVVNTADEMLIPNDVPHWRQVRYPGGQGWVNLNAANVRKFSDADFPHWQRWRLVDDSEDCDSRCDSPTLRGWVDTDGDGQVSSSELNARLSEASLASRLARTICKFPSEWEQGIIDRRWAWLQTSTAENPQPFTGEDFQLLRAHIQALAFLPGNTGLPTSHWHFQPREFVRHFRKCGWLNPVDLERALSSAPSAGRTRAEGIRISMNRMMQKYRIDVSRLRMTHFLAQVGHETGWWQFRQESGNERYFRTMYEVITAQEAAEDHRTGSADRLGLIRSGETLDAYAARRPSVVAEKARGMDNGVANADRGGQAGDGSRFRGRGFLQITGRRNYTSYQRYRNLNFTTDPKPSALATDNYNACDASGFFWVRENVNSHADAGGEASIVTRVGGLVNRGNASKVPLHDRERREAFNAIRSPLSDEP